MSPCLSDDSEWPTGEHCSESQRLRGENAADGIGSVARVVKLRLFRRETNLINLSMTRPILMYLGQKLSQTEVIEQDVAGAGA